jgi:hypothetical protein
MNSKFATKLAFRKAVVFWLVVVVGVFVAASFFHICTTQKDIERFRKILATQPKKIRKTQLKGEKEITRQIRRNVAKKLWISDGTFRKMLAINGITSEISVYSDKDKRKSRVVETFYGVSGIIQEQLLYRLEDGKEILFSEVEKLPFDTQTTPIQRFRYFEADSAVYDFRMKSLVATNIHFWTYTAEGHDLVESFVGLDCEAEGRATHMTLFSGSELQESQFFAEGLQLEIKSDKGI